MINRLIELKDIKFNCINFDIDLYESILKRGILIPIRVRLKDDVYECIDGHKRLSVLKKLSKTDEKFNKVMVMIVNDFSKAGSGYWGNTRNKH